MNNKFELDIFHQMMNVLRTNINKNNINLYNPEMLGDMAQDFVDKFMIENTISDTIDTAINLLNTKVNIDFMKELVELDFENEYTLDKIKEIIIVVLNDCKKVMNKKNKDETEKLLIENSTEFMEQILLNFCLSVSFFYHSELLRKIKKIV
jgi:hypothetical protein|tara:strand:- start:210 stop:662 length:453 start_codon:yes stop_codon:yes gene_type:complete